LLLWLGFIVIDMVASAKISSDLASIVNSLKITYHSGMASILNPTSIGFPGSVNIPDGVPTTFRNEDNTLLGYVSNQYTYQIINTSPPTMFNTFINSTCAGPSGPCPQYCDNLQPTYVDTDFDMCGRWLGGVDNNGTQYLGWYHAENRDPSLFDNELPCSYQCVNESIKSVGFATSNDGLTWNVGTHPNNRVLSGYDDGVNYPRAGDFSLYKGHKYYYMLYKEQSCPAVARSRISSGGGPGTWHKWNKDWTSPGLGGAAQCITSLNWPTNTLQTLTLKNGKELYLSFQSRSYGPMAYSGVVVEQEMQVYFSIADKSDITQWANYADGYSTFYGVFLGINNPSSTTTDHIWAAKGFNFDGSTNIIENKPFMMVYWFKFAGSNDRYLVYMNATIQMTNSTAPQFTQIPLMKQTMMGIDVVTTTLPRLGNSSSSSLFGYISSVYDNTTLALILCRQPSVTTLNNLYQIAVNEACPKAYAFTAILGFIWKVPTDIATQALYLCSVQDGDGLVEPTISCPHASPVGYFISPKTPSITTT